MFSLTCILPQGMKLSNECKKNTLLDTANGEIVLDCRIEVRDDWVASINLNCKRITESSFIEGGV